MKNYDKYQLKAIKSQEDTLLIAGAGSGKTHTIIGKVNYLIDNNICKRDDILIISFTNESVNDIKSKLSPDIDVFTFHKLGLKILDNKYKLTSNYELYFIIREYIHSYIMINKHRYNVLKRIYKIHDKPSFINIIISFLNVYKNQHSTINYLVKLYNESFFLKKEMYKILIEVYTIYENELNSKYMISVNDIIHKANDKILNSKINVNYKYIIIDEFQDTSMSKYAFIINLKDYLNATLFVVGDDYQSIYKFTGTNLNLFFNLSNKFKVLYLDNNYRNNKYQIKVANKFIMKNNKQIKKNINTFKTINKPIIIIYYKSKKTVISKVLELIKEDYIILGRYNRDKDKYNIKDNYLTMHKVKGLESENIIIVNLYNNTFPANKKKNILIDKLLYKDNILFEEERRLFYVALTRAKKYTYLLVPYSNQSSFVKEIIKENKNYLKFIYF